jgi:hypothetical protein
MKCLCCGKESYIMLFINHMVANEVDFGDDVHQYVRLGYRFRCN